MGWSPRYFRWDSEKWVRLTARWVDGLLNGTERLEGGGTALLMATVLVQFEDREPMAIAMPQCERWPLLADGSLDLDHVRQGAALALESVLAPLLAVEEDGKIIHAESRFARRRHQAESRWVPTEGQWLLLVPALTKAGIPPILARRVIESW